MKSILIIDDDRKLCKLLEKFLSSRGFSTTVFHNGTEVISKFNDVKVDLILLDVMMPGENGFEVLKKIRKISTIPVIMLTARGEISDKVVGLELGADDYVAKPFEAVEIEARINAVLRRIQVHKSGRFSEIISFSGFSLDFKRQVLFNKKERINLTSLEYALLEYLVRNRNQVISRGQITEYLNGDDFDPFHRNVDILVSRLRRKLLDDPRKSALIKTIHGRGYMFLGNDE